MSTKGLMAHKKVAEVTLNDAGKAATLTLAPGWAFEGSRGPFDLINVEHGHKIVKGAIADGSAPVSARAAPKRAPAQPSQPGVAPEPPRAGDRKPLPTFNQPVEPRGNEAFVYRLVLVPKGEEPKGQGMEYCAWLQMPSPLSKEALVERTWKTLEAYTKDTATGKAATRETHESASFRWTNKHQADARKKGELGSPWGQKGVNHG